MSINGSRATGNHEYRARARVIVKYPSRVQRQIKIYKYSKALTRITYTGARRFGRTFNGSSKLLAIYVRYMPASFTRKALKLHSHCYLFHIYS